MLRPSRPTDQAHAAAAAESPPANSSPLQDCPAGSRSACLPASHTLPGSAQQTECAADPSARIRSANPSTSRSQTSLVASGVTSRAASPVPPVVTIRSALLGMTAQRRGNQIQLIGQRLRRHNTHPGSLQRLADSRSGEVDLLPSRAAVADCQHNGANIGRKRLESRLPVYGFPPKFQKLRPNHFASRKEPQK